jgi:hypothetical protein
LPRHFARDRPGARSFTSIRSNLCDILRLEIGAAMTPDREAQRVAALRAYDVLGSEPERPYDEITELAAQVAQCPASIISFMDDSHLWPKARHGLPPNKAPLPREMFMCSSAAAVEHMNISRGSGALLGGMPQSAFGQRWLSSMKLMMEAGHCVT